MTTEQPHNERPLQGWKEIAAYLERDVRTAMRWEKSAGLPVRRHAQTKGWRVYAYPRELDAWRSGRPAAEPVAQPSVLAARPLIWGAVAGVAALAGFLIFLRSSALDPVAEAGAAASGVRTTELYKGGTVGAVSPDGRYLSETDWVNSGDIGIRDFETGEYRRLSDKGSWGAGYGEADRSIFSPDGKQIAYNWLIEQGGEVGYELRIIDAFADKPEARTIYSNLELKYIQPDGWTADNRLLVQFQRGDWSAGIGFVSIETGELEILKSPQPQTSLSGLQLSHDGRWIAYSMPPPGGEGKDDVYLLAADGSKEIPAIRHRADDFVAGFSTDDGTLLFVSDRTGAPGLWGASLSPEGEVGAPQILIRDIGSIGPMGVLPDGSFVYLRSMGSVDVYSARLDWKTGKLLREPAVVPTERQGSNEGPWLSADGRKFAYVARTASFRWPLRDGDRKLLIRDLESNEERELPVQGATLNPYYRLSWSPEGRRILSATRDEQGRWGLVEVDIETGKTIQVRGSADPQSRPVGWLSDGRTIVCNSESEVFEDGTVERTIEAIEPGQSRGRRLYSTRGVASANKFFQVTLSPQRDRLAWRDWSGGVEAIKVMPVEGGEARSVFEPGDGFWVTSIAWAPDGESLLVSRRVKGPKGDSSAWIVPLDGRAALETRLAGRFLNNVNVHPDGKTVYYLAGHPDPRIFRTENYLPKADPASE